MWQKARLGDVTEMEYGYTASAREDAVGPKLLRITDIVPDSIDWDSVPYCEINDNVYEKFKLQIGDIVVARTGATAGYAKLIRKNEMDAVFASYLIRIRPIHPDLLPDYLGRLIESKIFKRFVESQKGGSAQPQANAPVLKDFSFSFPEKSIQLKISNILSAYDDLIENNNRRIALLEESMRLLYREWFVRLRFPGHEHVRVIDGLPEGWEKKSIGDIVNESRDLVDPNEIEPDTPYVGLEHIPRKSISLTNWGKASDVASSKFRFLQGDILFGKIRPYFHKVVFAPLDGICSSDTIVFRACYPELFGFALAVISSEDFVNFTSKTSKEGAKMPRANVSEMEKYPILFPKIEILWEFNKIVVNLTKQISNLVFTNNKLSEARDLLLPRLMSGEIDVS